MANSPPNPANPNFNINLPPPSTTSNSSAPFTPRSSSYVDDSDAEFDPTPLQSPRGGPDYDDLPPSYDEAQHQAVSDARQGVTPLDPNQIEAHRLTLNEGPNEPEIWEYRVRGEQLDHDEEHERAPEYGNITSGPETAVPVQHVQSSESIPVGRVGPPVPPLAPDSAAGLLDRALNFTRHEPDADVQYAPRLTRPIAFSQEIAQLDQSDLEVAPVQFSRAYAKALHAHSIRPAEFVEFLDSLNALCLAANMSARDLLAESSTTNATTTLARDYITAANERFFAPRGLRVSLQSLSTLIQALDISTERGQRAAVVASVLNTDSTSIKRAQALHPWIEALEFDVPPPNAQTSLLQFMAKRHKEQRGKDERTTVGNDSEDPPYSVPEDATQRDGPHEEHHHRRGRGGHRGGPWTPFGAPGHGPFGLPGRGPFGPPGRGPFGGAGRGPFGSRGRGSFGPPGFGPRGPPHCGRDRGGRRTGGPDHPESNEWAALGQNLGKWGEEFGKRMGDWGQQFGKQAEDWGKNVGKRAENWGEQVSTQASGSGTGANRTTAQPHGNDTLPPSYVKGTHAQETGVLRGDSKTSGGPPGYDEHAKGKSPAKPEDDDDSSISSDSSDLDSDSDSDSDDDDLPDTEAIFLKRINSINKQAEAAAQKGKKSRQEIAKERAMAIETAQNEKTKLDLKVEEKLSRRSANKELRQKARDLKREHRRKKRELKASHTGKGKAKAKNLPEWKQAKKEYKIKRKELAKEKLRLRKEQKEARAERMKARKSVNVAGTSKTPDEMVWVVIENLGT